MLTRALITLKTAGGTAGLGCEFMRASILFMKSHILVIAKFSKY